jgi:hypothetical protein
MGGNRRHLPNQDTPSATPRKKILAESQLHFLSTKLTLKNRFPRGHRPTPQERLCLAKDLERAASELFDATARATLSGWPVSRCATVLQHVAERVTAQAVNTWNELSHQYRLVSVIQEPAKQRARLKQALPSERELPPIDAIDIAVRVHNILTHAADELEREVCEKALRHPEVTGDQDKHSATECPERETTELDSHPSPITIEGVSPDLGQLKGARVTDEQRPGQASDDLAKNDLSIGAEAERLQGPLREGAKRPRKDRKGDVSLFNGEPTVNFQIAETYLGIGERQRQMLMKSGALVVQGKRRDRTITTDSLMAYVPPKQPC